MIVTLFEIFYRRDAENKSYAEDFPLLKIEC